MAEGSVNRGEARQRILDTAETLFASQGVDAISLRQVNATAGVSPGVLHYHFGSREVLVHELINRHMGDLMQQRQELLTPLLDEDRPSVRQIMHGLVTPLAQLALSGGEQGQRYARFISRLYSDRSSALEEASQKFIEVNSLMPRLLRRALPDRDPVELDLKLAMANHAMLQILSDMTAPDRPWLREAMATVDNQRVVDMLIDFITDGICGQPRED